jgi:hypothetical protein
MTIDDLTAYKGVVFGEYERAKANNSSRLPSLIFQLASLEESIAEEQAKAGNPDRAAVNYVSQGSFLFEMGHIAEGKAAWELAKSLTTKDSLRNWIDEGLKQFSTGITECQS